MQNQQENLANINSNLVALQTQLEQAMNIMLENARRLQDIHNQLNNDFSSSKNIRPFLQVLLQVEQFYLQQQNKFPAACVTSKYSHYRICFRSNGIIRQPILS